MKHKNGEKKNQGDSQVLRIPKKLLAPVRDFLSNQLKKLEKRRAGLTIEDPFVTGRSQNLASPDTSAADQFGHERSEAAVRELDRKIVQIRKALARIKIGNYGTCERCGQMIDTERLVVFPETTKCVKCEREEESKKR